MAEGLTVHLFLAAFCIGLLGFILLRQVLSLPLALWASFVKVMIPLVYFAWFFDGIWTFQDDMDYTHQGIEMLSYGYSPLTALLDPSGLRKLFVLSGSFHIFYGWWNLTAQYLFGEHYYSAVFLNILAVFAAGFFFVGMLRELGFSEKYRRWCLLFFLFHWDITTWSSFVNLKDTLMMSLTLLSFFLLVKLFKKFRFSTLLLLSGVLFIFSWIRFYIPLLILTAAGIWMFFEWHSRKKYLLMPLMLIVLYFIFQRGSDNLGYLQPGALFIGIFKFLLTPQPWKVEENYSFLLFPSIFHWILIAPMFFAAWSLWNSSRARLLVIYFLIVVVFYGMVPELEGPRHRVQISFLVVWFQFHFLWNITKIAVQRHLAHPSKMNPMETIS